MNLRHVYNAKAISCVRTVRVSLGISVLHPLSLLLKQAAGVAFTRIRSCASPVPHVPALRRMKCNAGAHCSLPLLPCLQVAGLRHACMVVFCASACCQRVVTSYHHAPLRVIMQNHAPSCTSVIMHHQSVIFSPLGSDNPLMLCAAASRQHSMLSLPAACICGALHCLIFSVRLAALYISLFPQRTALRLAVSAAMA